MTADAVSVTIMGVLEQLTRPETNGALFKDIDCLQIPVPDVEAGLAFYRDALGHALIWRTPTAAGLQMADSASEIGFRQMGSRLKDATEVSRISLRYR